MFHSADIYGAENGLVPVADDEDIQFCRNESVYETYICDETVYNLCVQLLHDGNLPLPCDSASCSDTYKLLRREIANML